MSLGPWQFLLIVVVVVLLFGRGKISELMGDVAKGIKTFKKGMADDEDETTAAQPKAIDNQGKTVEATATTTEKSQVS